MLISHKHKFIFIHIYKTAGTSVTDVFLPYSRLIDRLVNEYKYSKKIALYIVRKMGWYDDGMKQFTGFHKHAKAWEFKEKLGRERFGSYFKFTFVRNPFDLLVSLYFYISQDRAHPNHRAVASMSFPEFVKWHIAQSPPHQLNFVIDPTNGERLVDYIGRFETLEKDMGIIEAKLSIQSAHHLPHQNPSSKRKSKNFREYYDDESRCLVQEYFRHDLSSFGYDFEGFEDTMPIMQNNA